LNIFTAHDILIICYVAVGLSGAMSNVSVGRRAGAAGVADDCHGFLLEQMQHHSTTPPRKRSHSATPTGPATPTAAAAAAMDTSSPTPPSHKRFKLDDSVGPDLWYVATDDDAAALTCVDDKKTMMININDV